MTLRDLLSALKTDVLVTLMDTKNEEIIKFYSGGYTGVESDILDKTIVKFYINTGAISIVVEADPEPEPEPTPDPEPEVVGTTEIEGTTETEVVDTTEISEP